MARLTTEPLFWHRGDHTVKLESAACRRFLIAKICCFPWHVGQGHAQASHARTHPCASRWTQSRGGHTCDFGRGESIGGLWPWRH